MRWREKFFWWKIYENELGDNIPHTLCIPHPQPFYNFFPLTLKRIWERLLGRGFENDQNLCMLASPRIAKQVASMRKDFKTESGSQGQ